MTETLEEKLEFPDGGLSFAPPLRAYHLTGGLSVLIASNRLAMLMPGETGMTLFSVSKEPSKEAPLSAHLKGQEGIRHIGSNYFHAADEMNDAVTQFFATSISSQSGQCLAHEQSLEWGGIGNVLHKSGRGADALVATRVASQIRACLARLERLSMAYRTVLSEARVKRQTTSPSTFTSDKYAAFLGIEYRAMLNELYALRDALLAGAYRFRFKRDGAYSLKKIKALVLSEANGVAKLIFDSMFSESGDLLIDHMGLYRSVAQHCLGSSNPVFGDVYQLRLSTGPFGDLPYLVYPLYDDIEKMREIERGSSKGILERPSIEEAKRFGSVGKYRDALDFCYDCFERLLKIGELLRKETDIESQPIQISEEEILEIAVTDETGKVWRAKRDESGRLTEY